MEKWVDEGAADGFNMFMDVYPEGLETFADQVIPLLQKRGRFRLKTTKKKLYGNGLVSSPKWRTRVQQSRGVGQAASRSTIC